MEIRYYSYDEEIIDNIESGKIHIFPKSIDKTLAKSRYMEGLEDKNSEKTPNIFRKQPKFMGLGEFKTSLFLSDEMILREEKQVIAFYRSLSKENRRELGVESYYDVIDIVANFLNFFKLLKEYRLEKIDGLRKWQERIYKLFLDIEKNYIKFLSEKGYTDPTFIICDENYTSGGLGDYREIIFYNKLYFTPLEKSLIEKLEKDGFKIILKLQLNKEEFCEENLSIKSISLEKDLKTKLEIITLDDEFTELLKILEIKEKEENEKVKFNIYDANNEKYRYNNFFDEARYISDLPIFSLLEGIYQLLSTIEEIDNELAIELHTVVEIIKGHEISKYYNIDIEELEKFKKIVNEGYKYLTKYTIAEFLGEDHFIMKIFEDIEEMKNYDNLEKWIEKLTFSEEELLKLLKNSENIGKYFEALSEIAVIEELDIVDGWKGFFGYEKTSEGLLKLILKYLEFKEVQDGNQTNLKKKGLEEIPTKSNKNLLLMNITDRFIPNIKQNTFLFTEQQKKDLGIKGIDEIRLEEKYNLFRSIMTSEKTTILAIKNMEDDSSISPFVEELMEKLGIDSRHLKQPIENYIEVISPKANREKIEQLFFHENPKEMDFNLDELKTPFRINPYMCSELFNCKYKMNLRYIERLEREELEVDRNLTRREYGILAHELFEEVLKRIERNKEYSLLEKGKINLNLVMTILEEFIGKRRLKLPKLNEKYYTEVIYKNLANSVGEFFSKISKELKGEKIKRLIIEKNLDRELKNKFIKISGRGKADLIIKTENREFIIDFKTGGMNEMQLDFYSILYAGEADLTEKYIFNVDKCSLEKPNKIRLVKDETGRNKIDFDGKNKTLKVLETELEEFFNLGVFQRTDRNSSCGRCEYIDICKVGEIVGDEK
jgi:hypothetical protein